MENSQTDSSNVNSDGGSLNFEADRATIDTLYADGFLSKLAYESALNCVPRQREWWTWVNRSLLFSGAALALAGIVFFFAYNWHRMPSMAKFTLVEIVLVGCLIGAWKIGLDRIGGQVLLLGASMMVGVFLAVFGQVYQTGADAYQLFVAWAVLIFAWVLLGRFGALWIMWLALLNIGVMLYFSQVVQPNYHYSDETLFLILSVINSIALIARELCYKVKVEWLTQGWLRWTLLISVLLYLLIPSETYIIESSSMSPTLALPFLVIVILVAFFLYFLVLPDLFSVTLCTLTACTMSLTAVGRVLLGTNDPFSWLLFGIIVVITVSVTAFVLRLIGMAMAKMAKQVQK